MASVASRLGTGLLALALTACSAVRSSASTGLTAALEAGSHDHHSRAAAEAWRFLQQAPEDDARRVRATQILAENLEQLHLSSAAALLYRQIASERKDLEVVPDAMRGLERVLGGPHDTDWLLTSFLAADDHGFLPQGIDAFVAYHQSLDLLRRGELAWAEARMADITDGPYEAEARYARATRHVVDGEDAAAATIFEGLLTTEIGPDLRYRAALAAARLAYGRDEAEAALRYYEQAREHGLTPEVLLEMAWTHWQLDRPREALGLLVALRAPVHAHFVAPDSYILQALVLRRLCQHDALVATASALFEDHGDVLDALDHGAAPHRIEALRRAAAFRSASRPLDRATRRLAWEADSLARVHDPDLRSWLTKAYAGLEASLRPRAEAQLAVDAHQLAEELVAAEDAVSLMLHELGVAMVRGRRHPDGALPLAAAERPALTGAQPRVAFPFDGEYWTDELDDLVVLAEDRCID